MAWQPAAAGPGSLGGSRLPQLEILPVLGRFWKMILTITVVVAAAAYGLSYLQSTRYRATSQMILSDPRNAGVFRDESQVVIDPQRYVSTQAQLAVSTPALVRASELIGGRVDAAELDDLVTARASLDLDLVTITSLDASPEGAKEIADAVGQAYQDLVREEVQGNADASIAELDEARAELQARIDELEEVIALGGDTTVLQAERDAAAAELVNLSARAKEIAVDAALYGSGVQVFEAAELPEGPAQPRPLRNAVLAGILGLLAACVLAWWLGQRHRIAESRHDPAPVLGAPLLGVIPDLVANGSADRAPVLTQPGSVGGEAFRFVASSLDSAVTEQEAVVVSVTSARQGEGKTLVALNVAAAVALGGKRVVLVDGDVHARGLSRWVRQDEAKGLTDLGNGAPADECVRRLEWSTGHLAVCPVGSPTEPGAGFFHSVGFRRALAALREQGDLIIIDAPPALASADTLAITGKADGAVLVVEYGTPLHLIGDAGSRIATAGTPVLGYVFNRARGRGLRYGYRDAYGYGYGHRYGYGYGYGDAGGERATGAGRAKGRRTED